MKEVFSKELRLRKKHEFIHLFSKKQVLRGKYILFHWNIASEALPKLGLSVSCRFGNSPTRNRFKRLLREIFRKNLQKMPRGLEVNCSPMQKIENLRYQELEEDFFYLLKKI